MPNYKFVTVTKNEQKYAIFINGLAYNQEVLFKGKKKEKIRTVLSKLLKVNESDIQIVEHLTGNTIGFISHFSKLSKEMGICLIVAFSDFKLDIYNKFVSEKKKKLNLLSLKKLFEHIYIGINTDAHKEIDDFLNEDGKYSDTIKKLIEVKPKKTIYRIKIPDEEVGEDNTWTQDESIPVFKTEKGKVWYRNPTDEEIKEKKKKDTKSRYDYKKENNRVYKIDKTPKGIDDDTDKLTTAIFKEIDSVIIDKDYEEQSKEKAKEYKPTVVKETKKNKKNKSTKVINNIDIEAASSDEDSDIEDTAPAKPPTKNKEKAPKKKKASSSKSTKKGKKNTKKTTPPKESVEVDNLSEISESDSDEELKETPIKDKKDKVKALKKKVTGGKKDKVPPVELDNESDTESDEE
ncbi:MAG: hypothetical protein ACOCRK_00595 [bacterium]